MAQTGLRPSTHAMLAATRTWHELGPEHPMEDRLTKSVEAAFAQHSDDSPGWRSIVALLILAGTFLATVALFKH